MTLFYAAIDTAKKELRWVRAGHDPSAASFTELGGRGMAIGVDSNYCYREGGIFDLSEGQVLVIGTNKISFTRRRKWNRI
jgi:sigma-B regulation protein RsbU (phosphoserine phosphatase)